MRVRKRRRRGGPRAAKALGATTSLELEAPVQIVGDAIEARFCVALPARGRTILGEWASQILTETLPSLVHASLYHAACDARALKAHLDAVEDQRAARALLRGHNLIAFVADGAILPRKSGASDLPLDAAAAVPFASPPELAVELALPNAGAVRGMGIRRGVTLVAGGGFHGKSTLLGALQLGVYDQLPGDGRERVVTDGDAVKVRAEDVRAVTSVDAARRRRFARTRVLKTPRRAQAREERRALGVAHERAVRADKLIDAEDAVAVPRS